MRNTILLLLATICALSLLLSQSVARGIADTEEKGVAQLPGSMTVRLDQEGNRGAGVRASAPSEVNPNGDLYVKKYPYSTWRHINRIEEAQEFGQQKREVIVALIGDMDDLPHPSLATALWVNAREQSGKPGVDDDGNGWVDDIHGINTGGEVANIKMSMSIPAAGLIAGVANYSKERLANPGGLVKLMPIAAFKRGVKCCEDGDYRSDDGAILEALTYAAKMNASIIVMPDYYALNANSKILELVSKFNGLIITCISREDKYDKEYGVLSTSHIDNVLSIGFQHQDGRLIRRYGGESDVSALGYTAAPWGHSDANVQWNPLLSASIVGGAAAHMMSCYPKLSPVEIKNLIMVSADSNPLHAGITRTGGTFNAARASLGRAAGGVLYLGDWARIDSSGPDFHVGFSLAYDHRHGLLYVCSDTQLWSWDWNRWSQIKFKKENDYSPWGTGKPFIYYDDKDDELILVKHFGEKWAWNGTKWRREEMDASGTYNIRKLNGGPRSDNTAYDSINNKYLYYSVTHYIATDKLNYVMLEGENGNWKKIGLKNIHPEDTSSIIFDTNDNHFVTLSYNIFPHNTNGLWVYENRKWQISSRVNIPGIGGAYVYDDVSNISLRIGSRYYNTRDTLGVDETGRDVWRCAHGEWSVVGYDMPLLDSGYQGIWSSDRRKVLILGVPEPNSPGHSANHALSIWQYSGGMKPTWIDNLILPQSDYTGDGSADVVLWQPAKGRFHIRGGEMHSRGSWGDVPVPGDYKGSGNFDFAVCRPQAGQNPGQGGFLRWIFEDSEIKFGQFDDIPVPLDYDGDGKTDIAVFRKDTGKWLSYGKDKAISFGNPADLPVPADYDGDGKPELATYTPLTSTWHIQGIGDIQWGEPGDSPIPADYDGDGRKEIATWNPRKALWLVRDWRDGTTLIKKTFGNKWDIPVPGDYNGDGKAELATYSPITTLWSISGRAPIKFGTPGDVPLVRGN